MIRLAPMRCTSNTFNTKSDYFGIQLRELLDLLE